MHKIDKTIISINDSITINNVCIMTLSIINEMPLYLDDTHEIIIDNPFIRVTKIYDDFAIIIDFISDKVSKVKIDYDMRKFIKY